MSLAQTRIQDIVSRSRLDKNEFIRRQFGALDLFIDQSKKANSLIPGELKQRALGSIGTGIKFPVLKYNGDVQVSSARSCVIPAAENTSAMVELTFITYFVGVSMIPSLYMNNEISYERDLAKKLLDASRAMQNKMDQDAITALAAAKTQVLNEQLLYDFTGNVLTVPFIAKDNVLGDLDPMFSANGFDGGIHVLSDFALQALILKLGQLGPQNMVNKHLEYLGKNYWTSKNMVKESGQFSTFYAIEDGNLDLVCRADREAVRGAAGAGHEWWIGRLPELDLPMGIHYYEEVGDFSKIASGVASDATADAAFADMTCVLGQKWGFSIDVAYVTAYNSAPTTLPNPYLKGVIESGQGFGLPVYVTNQSQAAADTTEQTPADTTEQTPASPETPAETPGEGGNG